MSLYLKDSRLKRPIVKIFIQSLCRCANESNTQQIRLQYRKRYAVSHPCFLAQNLPPKFSLQFSNRLFTLPHYRSLWRNNAGFPESPSRTIKQKNAWKAHDSRLFSFTILIKAKAHPSKFWSRTQFKIVNNGIIFISFIYFCEFLLCCLFEFDLNFNIITASWLIILILCHFKMLCVYYGF